MSDLFAAVCSIAPTRRRRFLWAVWWSAPPSETPFRAPDAYRGGARTPEEALRDAGTVTARPLVPTDARWARAWINVLAGRPAWPSRPSGTGRTSAAPRPAASEAQASAWAILGVEQGASAQEIKRAYRRRALETHPDRGGNAQSFQAVQRAYERALARAARPRSRRK